MYHSFFIHSSVNGLYAGYFQVLTAVNSAPMGYMCLFQFWFPRRQWHPTPVLLPGKSHGRRSLEGCSPWGHWGLDTTERLPFHFPLSCIGKGNGNLLQCSCLENPRDGGAWWALNTTEVTQQQQQQQRVLWWVVLFLVNERTLQTVLHEAVSIYIPTNSARWFPFNHSLSSIYHL